MIIPISLVSADGFYDLRKLLLNSFGINWFSSYSMRPSKLFDGVEKHLSIWIGSNGMELNKCYTSKYHRWLTSERDTLFDLIQYSQLIVQSQMDVANILFKVGSINECILIDKLTDSRSTAGSFCKKHSEFFIYHTRKLRYFLQFVDTPPKIIGETGEQKETSELKTLFYATSKLKDSALSTYCSTLFFWYFSIVSDCRNLNKREVFSFPMDLDLIKSSNADKLSKLSKILMNDMQINSTMKKLSYKKQGDLIVQIFAPRLSKPIIDKIDTVLAQHYGFTEEELDFIINYDIKYRMGRDGEDSDSDD